MIFRELLLEVGYAVLVVAEMYMYVDTLSTKGTSNDDVMGLGDCSGETSIGLRPASRPRLLET